MYTSRRIDDREIQLKRQNRIYFQTAWWTVLFPALAVVSLIVAVSLLADALREPAE